MYRPSRHRQSHRSARPAPDAQLGPPLSLSDQRVEPDASHQKDVPAGRQSPAEATVADHRLRREPTVTAQRPPVTPRYERFHRGNDERHLTCGGVARVTASPARFPSYRPDCAVGITGDRRSTFEGVGQCLYPACRRLRLGDADSSRTGINMVDTAEQRRIARAQCREFLNGDGLVPPRRENPGRNFLLPLDRGGLHIRWPNGMQPS